MFNSQFEKQGYYCSDATHLEAGGPGTHILHMLPKLMEDATRDCLKEQAESDAQLFQYGLNEGNWKYRTALADFLSEQYGEPVDSNQLYLTGGASSGLWLLLTMLFHPGTVVFVEDPTYFAAIKQFEKFNASIISVKTDENGIVLKDLEQKLNNHLEKNPTSNRQSKSAVLYLVPVFQNPTGSLLTPDRCTKVIALCRQYNVLIICDDVYNLLHYDDCPTSPRRLFALDNQLDPDYNGNVVSNGSFSKFLAPGLRLGWLEAPKWIIETLDLHGMFVSGGGFNTYTSGLVTNLMKSGRLKAHVDTIRKIYKDNMTAVSDILRGELPSGCYLHTSDKGGYFLWVELNINSTNFLPFCKKEYRVAFQPGQRSSPLGGYQNFLRIAVTFYERDVLVSAVKQLCVAIKDFQQRAAKDPLFWKSYI